MLPRMMRALVVTTMSALFVGLVGLLGLAPPALASPAPVAAEPARSAPIRIAKAPKKKKGAPVEKAAPEGARSDPRASAPPAAEAPPVDIGGRRAMGRIEFDDRLIQGQTNKANAIYLFERRESALRSLLKKRTHFHDEIDETLE